MLKGITEQKLWRINPLERKEIGFIQRGSNCELILRKDSFKLKYYANFNRIDSFSTKRFECNIIIHNQTRHPPN